MGKSGGKSTTDFAQKLWMIIRSFGQITKKEGLCALKTRI